MIPVSMGILFQPDDCGCFSRRTHEIYEKKICQNQDFLGSQMVSQLPLHASVIATVSYCIVTDFHLLSAWPPPAPCALWVLPKKELCHHFFIFHLRCLASCYACNRTLKMCRPKDTALGCSPELQIQLTHVPINQISVHPPKKEWVTR